MRDRELIDAVLDGDGAAQREFYDRHVEQVFALAYRMTGQETAARDCTQTAFIRMFDKLESFRGDAALSTWVHAVAVSAISDWRRQLARRRAREVGLDAADDVAAPAARPGDVIDGAVGRAIDALSARYRTVVVMHDIEGYTHDEIGKALGITAGASKVRLARARKKLRATLAGDAEDLLYG